MSDLSFLGSSTSNGVAASQRNCSDRPSGVPSVSTMKIHQHCWTPTDRAAFRQCVYTEDTPALLDADNWPENITISDWHFNAKDRLQSALTVAIYDAGSLQPTSADKVTIAADHPAEVEHCDEGEPSAATSPRSAVTKVLGILRSMETLSVPSSPSIDPVCSDVVPIDAAGDVGAMDIHTDNIATIN